MNCSHNCLQRVPGFGSSWTHLSSVQKVGGVAPISGQKITRDGGISVVAVLLTIVTLSTFTPVQTQAAAPAISTPPQSQTVNAGATVNLSVTATGDAPLTYEWWGEFGPLVPAHTNASLSLTNVNLTEAGSYKVIVRNASGAVTSAAASLTVNPAPASVGENFLWAHRLGGTGANPGANLAVDAAGNSCVIGSFTGTTTISGNNLNSAGGSDVFVARFNRAGALLWARSAGGTADDFGTGIAIDNFGNIHITGTFSANADFNSTSLTNAGGHDLFVACYDRDGNLLWASRAGGAGDDVASRIAVDGTGNSYIAGSFAGSLTFAGVTLTGAGGDDVLLAKFSSTGVPLWAKRFGGPAGDAATSLALGSGGTVFLAGRFRGSADFGSVTLADGGTSELFLAKCNSAGSVQWAKKVLGADASAGASVVAGDDGTAYLNGTFSGLTTFGTRSITNREVMDHFVARYDTGGTVLFASCVGGLTGQNISLGIKSSDGGTVNSFASVSDFASGGTNLADLVLAKFTGPNTLAWARQAGGNFAEFSLGHSLDDAGNQYLVGFFEDTLTGTEDPNYSLASIRLAKSSPPLPPLIMVQPQNVVTTFGSSASFTVTVSSAAAVSYQWRLNGTNLPGFTSATCSINNTQPGHAGNYQVLVTSVDGSALSSEAVLNLGVPPDLTAPTVVIASPAVNARFTNAAIIITGTASDNIAVARVEVQINSGAFIAATGATNWSASVTLAAGTNTVRVKSIDVADNESAVATRSFIYAPVSPLTLTVNGSGSVSPNLNGQFLEIGGSYSLTATPAAGYSFTGWSGGASSSSATLNFTMQPGLALQASFADLTAPTVAISTPAANAKFTNAAVTMTGTASDSASWLRVEVQINNGSFFNANGTANWSASLTLPAGTNSIRARSIDAAGNVSALASRSLIFAPVSPITISVNGFGSVTPDLNGQLLELGASYTVTAVPGANTLFTSWAGASSSTNAALTFTMSSGLSLQANFATNPPPDLTAPNVAISSPAAGAKFNSASLTVYGTASDDTGLARIELQLNNGSFFTATGTSNWSASVTLVAGTNTLRARAIDAAGNLSSSASRSVVFAPLSALTLLVNGSGVVTPNLNGQSLESGSNYTVTATPGAGYTFIGWSGGSSSTNATLTFTMQPGLSLQANFVDLAPPTVTITAPAAYARFNESAILIQGTATDAAGIDSVECQLNSGSWIAASGTTAWSVLVNLAPGTNVIRIRCFDSSFNESTMAARTFVFAPISGFTLLVSGAGAVSPNLNGQALEVGSAYTVTATPAAGYTFLGWSGAASGTSPVLNFTMQSNLVVQANFADLNAPNIAFSSPANNAKFTNSSVTFTGTATDGAGLARVEVQVNDGSFQVANGTASWSASLTLAPGTNVIRARAIDLSDNVSALISRSVVYAPMAPLVVTINGGGGVSPNLNGQLLEIGASYSMTASPTSGYSFGGWSGGVSESSATLAFTMQAGLAIQANFTDAGAPTIAFTSPVNNAKFTNNILTLTGTAGDNVSVARVEYRINGGLFSVASGAANWSATLTLPPGTNAIQVKSVDDAGNESALASRSFIYAPVAPLTLTVNGNGSVSPLANGQFLELGATHNLTASPASGWRFTGWSGDVSGTNTTLAFVMQSGLRVQANFADATAPSVAFTSPASNAKFTNAVVAVTGTASDNVALTRVEYQLGNGPFVVATGSSNWSANITLASGTNTLRVRAIDAAGNVSATASRSFIFAPVSLFTVTVNGSGTVAPGLNGQLLEIGASYSITAIPGAGFAFGGWSGDASGTNATLNFTMVPNMTVQANFSDATAPSIVITTPVAGSRFTNASVTLTGTASDNVAVSRVDYSLNNGAFSIANGTTNWSASLTLAPGTNTIRTKSIDNLGNESALVSRSVIYAPAAPLTLLITGSGSVTPNLHGQWLEVGASYAMTALPSSGFDFSGWTGGLTNNTTALSFVMRSNLVLRANFVDATPPSVSITSPAPSLKVFSAAATVLGTAADNVGVTRVEVQLNGGGFTAAVGTMNWSASLTLAPGTNRLRARSFDAASNSMTSAERTLVYAPLAPLTLGLNGHGMIMPDLNGQFLEIGSQYSLTAVPTPGNAFYGWTGSVTTTGATLNFTMQAGYALVANFRDATAPGVAILSPAAESKFVNAAITIEGMATDNTGVARVEVQLNGGSFNAASGTSDWQAALNLVPGTNLVIARSIDLDGNISATVERRFIYAPTAPLLLAVNGSGSIVPDLSGQSLEIGTTYVITAAPEAGNVFTSWSGSAIASNAALTFIMQPGLVFVANFITGPTNPVIPNPATTNLLPRAKGTFYGLFYEEDGAQPHSAGLFTLTATDKGRFSASIEVGGKRLPFTGQFTENGRATNTVKRTGTNALLVTLRVNLPNGGDYVLGEVSNGEWTSELLAEKNVFHSKTNPAPFAGRYTILIPGGTDPEACPTGDGYGTVVVAASGLVTVAATLADGTKVSERIGAGRSGFLPLYTSLYSGKGCLISWLRFIERDSDDLTGLMNWLKPALPKAKLYPEGFALETTALGSSYTPPATRTNRVLNFESGFVELSGGNLPFSFACDVQLTAANKVVNLGANKLTLTITTSSGLFSGTTVNPVTKKTVSFRGALLQKGNYGAGMFAGTNQIGRVTFGP